MLYRVGLILGLSIVAMTGCSRLSVSNNSMDYKEAVVLPPLRLPAGEVTRPLTAIYPTPQIDPAALEQAPNYSNKRGNRFEMPTPQSLQEDMLANPNLSVGMPSRPVLVTDGNGYPLLKIEGDANRIWDLLNAALSVGNFDIVDRHQAKRFVQIKHDGQEIFLSLNRTGTITSVTIQDESSKLIDKALAKELLTQINQNWPV